MSYIEKIIGDDEKIEFTIHYHWVINCLPITLCLIGIMVIFTTSPILGFVWFIGGLLVYLSNQFTEQGFTTKKGYKKTGIIGRKTEELLLKKVETVEINQGIMGRMLDYGNIKLTGTGNSDLIFRSVRSPMEIKKNIDSLVN